MNRATAERLVKQLGEVRVDRGATAPEAATAARKAAELRARYGLSDPPRAKPPPPGGRAPAPRPAPPVGFPWVGGLRSAWNFDVQTGAASDNVKVHRYDGPGSWRIEIFD
jgi:hypothetical protein